MDSHFEQNALSWGAGGAEWLKRLPDMISEYESKWSFKAHTPFELNYNYVAPVELADGIKAVIKIGYPEDREFQSEITALQTFNGEGICRLLQVDQPNAAMLLERIMPGTVLGSIEDDDEATRTIANVMKQLHKPLPETHNFITIAEWVTAIPEYKAKHGTDGILPAHLVDKAGELFAHLIATSQPPMLLHGDLHHHNILLSAKRGWVAIDPKGVAAEPVYEVAAMIRNPYDKLKSVTNLEPLLQRRIAILSEELGFEATRIRDWCFAQCMLSAVWSAEGVKGPSHALRVAEVLDTLSI